MTLRPFLADDGTGVRHFWRDNPDGTATIVSQQDVAPILEQNKKLLTENDGYTPSRDMRRVASIPSGVLAMWAAEGWNPFDPANRDELRKRLDSSDWAHLRTAPGRLGGPVQRRHV